MSLFSRNPKVMFGQVCILGRRITVNFIKGRHRGGDSVRQIAQSYGLPLSTVRAALEYGLRRITAPHTR
jgi:uncharacterized protein (DUF433 family)